MAEAPGSTRSPDAVSMRIAASPERIYAIVSDIAQMGRLSPECVGGRWLGGADGPAVGASFRGWNHRGLARWWTKNCVVAAKPGEEFAFETKQSGIRWTYRMEPDGDGTVVTESRTAFKPFPLVPRIFTAVALGGNADHVGEMRAGMRTTLERLKVLAEDPD